MGNKRQKVEHKQWHDDSLPMSLGCSQCIDKPICGGLRVSGSMFNCLDYCCGDQDNCTNICRRRPSDFINRLREVNGFDLKNVKRFPKLDEVLLPKAVPLLFHGNRRIDPFASAQAVCLPMFKLFGRRDGVVRYETAGELARDFVYSEHLPVILSGTEDDPPLERFWALGPRRIDTIRSLKKLNVAMVTTPNFSVFTGIPRWDNLHAMKRIAIVQEEFQQEGIPAALHLNARTNTDWYRWQRYLAARPEITNVAFEFGTGAGWETRMDWYIDRLLDLASATDRPLRLLLRGGIRALPRLRAAYSVTYLDTTVFSKTVRRQVAIPGPSEKLKWQPYPTAPTEPLDGLLATNWNRLESLLDTNPILEQVLHKVG